MEQAVDRASTVTRKLLAFSRRQAVQPTVLDLNAVLSDLQPIFRQLMTDNVNVRLETDRELWRVKADQGQIEQVVVNLATNARDAMPRGGPLRIVTRNQRVESSSSDRRAAARRLRGPRGHRRRHRNGRRRAGENLRAVLLDKAQGSRRRPRARDGSRHHHPGRRTRDGRNGAGRGHDVPHLPSRAPPKCLDYRTTLQEAISPAPVARTVLLVDDEPSVRAITRRLLERAGYRVLEAADGHEALSIAAPPGCAGSICC